MCLDMFKTCLSWTIMCCLSGQLLILKEFRESKKYKDKAPKNKRKFFDKLSFLIEKLEEAEKVKFDLVGRETLLFSIQIQSRGTTILRSIVIGTSETLC